MSFTRGEADFPSTYIAQCDLLQASALKINSLLLGFGAAMIDVFCLHLLAPLPQRPLDLRDQTAKPPLPLGPLLICLQHDQQAPQLAPQFPIIHDASISADQAAEPTSWLLPRFKQQWVTSSQDLRYQPVLG